MRHVFAVINTVGVEAVFLQMEFFCLFRTADNCNVVDFVCSPIDEADVALPHSELRVHAPFHVGTDINDAGQTVTVTASPKTGDAGVGKYVSLGSIALGTAIIVVVVSNVKRRKKNK